jgi:hypothetical protein
VRAVTLVMGALACAGCGAPEPTSFIALERDFADYASWESTTFETTAFEGTEVPHDASVRRVFLSARPPAGATRWPPGTLLVKELPDVTLAMARRGGGFNAAGLGWEWFELARDDAGAVRIKWRGLGAPLGSEYGKSGNTCNVCHASAVELDGVLTPAFRLDGP